MIVLRHVAIRSQDISRTRRFYEEGLGLTFLGYQSDGVAMDLSDGTCNLRLLPYEGAPRAPREEGTEFTHLGFLVDDAGRAYQRLKAIGAEFVRDDIHERRQHDPSAPPPRSFKVLDPDGNVVDVSDYSAEWRTN